MEVNVATDLWGRKHNLRLTFPRGEVTLAELFVRAESAYRVESIALRPPPVSEIEVPPFAVVAATILVDDETSKWVELVSAKQLYDRCQVFVFQPPHAFHSDSRDLIPLPRSPLNVVSADHLENYRAEAMMLSRHLSQPPPPPPAMPFVHQPHRDVTSPYASPSTTATPPRQAANQSVVASSAGRRASPHRQGGSDAERSALTRVSAAASPSRQRPVFTDERAASPGRDYRRPEPLAATHLDLVHEIFGSIDKHGGGRVSVTEVKAAVVTAGFVPSELDTTGELTAPHARRYWEFADWIKFCEEHPTILPVIAESRGIRLGGFRASNELPAGVPAGSDLHSRNVDRNLSPTRSRQSAAERQRSVAERLHGGLASVVTAKDRERSDCTHAVKLLPLGTQSAASLATVSSPRRQSPARSSRY